MNQARDGALGVSYEAFGPSQDVTVNAIGHGDPNLTGDSPGAQEIDITDTADTIQVSGLAGVDGGCVAVSSHQVRCYASRTRQLGWRTSHCSYPSDCTGPGPTGLLDEVDSVTHGQNGNFQDTPGSTPIQEQVLDQGSGDISLWSGRVNRVELYGPNQRAALRPGSGATQAVTGQGHVFLDARNGQANSIYCGSGQSLILTDQQSYVAPSCTNVFRF
jgi:hypothetical protein